jgi:hypothetical protein
MAITPNASWSDVLLSAGIEEDPRGKYPAKKYRTCLHMAALFAAGESALRAKDKEIARLNEQLANAYKDNSKLAADKAEKTEQIGRMAMDKVRIGLESNPHISEVERRRLVG